MPRQYTAADLLAVSLGERSFRVAPTVASEPLVREAIKPALSVPTSILPTPRQRDVSAADILAISRHAQPWHALVPAAGQLKQAG